MRPTKSLLKDGFMRYTGTHPVGSYGDCFWVGSFIFPFGGVSERDFEIGRAFYF
jgi:hypothetical protein